MTSMSMRGAGDEIAELRNEIEKLKASARTTTLTGVRQRSWRRPIALVGIAVLAVGMVAGVAGASGSTTNVSFVALSPAKTILSNVTIATKKTSSPVVIGGSTTVPANATTVELAVSAKGASIGTLNFYPALNPSGASGQTLSYPGSNVVATATIQENVGQGGALTFYNNGIGSAVVTAKIIGYSTQVTAGDINGVGGTAGQVLTNDGVRGASWQPLGHAYSSASGNFVTSLPQNTWQAIGTLTVPAGTYAVSSTAVFQAGGPAGRAWGFCKLAAPSGATVQTTFVVADSNDVNDTAYSFEGVVTTPGGVITESCIGEAGLPQAGNANIVAVTVGSATGAITTARRSAPTVTNTSQAGLPVR